MYRATNRFERLNFQQRCWKVFLNMVSTAEYRAYEQRRTPVVELIAVVFFVMSLGMLGYLAFLVMSDAAFRMDGFTLRLRLWELTRSIGIVGPIVVVFAAVMLMRLSFQLRSGSVGAARWALAILNWLSIVSLLAVIVAGLRENQTGAMSSNAEAVLNILPWGIAFVVIVFLRQLVATNIMYFIGDEDITDKNTRRAWNLLAPTIIVFLAIALTPLEQVFLTSLTDERFASSQDVTFVGVEKLQPIMECAAGRDSL